MKSLVMTLIIFAAICLLLSFDILDILMSSNFLYLSLSILAIVIICAITFIGVPQIRTTNKKPLSARPQKGTSAKTKKTVKRSSKKVTKNENI